MKTKEFKVHYIYNSKGNRVELGYAEIQTLLFLNEQSFLSLPQLIEFTQFVQTISSGAFRNKVTKWEEAGLIKKQSVRLQNGHSAVIVSLAGAGLTVLKKLGYVSSDARARKAATSNLDHSLAIRQTILDVIEHHRTFSDALIYLAKGLYYVGIQPNVFFNTLTKPVIIYKTSQLGEDCIDHFVKYDIQLPYECKETLLTSINPYKEKDTEVVADWLFEVRGQYLHFELDCGNERINQSSSGNDTSFEGKITRLQPQLEKKEIEPSNYHVFFIMVDNREDAVLTHIHPTRVKRIANTKQEMARFKNFSDCAFETYIIRFSRSRKFLENFFYEMKVGKTDSDYLFSYMEIPLKYRENSKIKGWTFEIVEQEDFKKINIFPSGSYIPEKVILYKNESTGTNQIIIPFYAEEGNVKNAEKLAVLSENIKTSMYSGFAKILVFYNEKDNLMHDVIRKNRKNSNDKTAMETSRMIFTFGEYDEELEFYDESKKPLDFREFFDLT